MIENQNTAINAQNTEPRAPVLRNAQNNNIQGCGTACAMLILSIAIFNLLYIGITALSGSKLVYCTNYEDVNCIYFCVNPNTSITKAITMDYGNTVQYYCDNTNGNNRLCNQNCIQNYTITDSKSVKDRDLLTATFVLVSLLGLSLSCCIFDLCLDCRHNRIKHKRIEATNSATTPSAVNVRIKQTVDPHRFNDDQYRV